MQVLAEVRSQNLSVSLTKADPPRPFSFLPNLHHHSHGCYKNASQFGGVRYGALARLCLAMSL